MGIYQSGTTVTVTQTFSVAGVATDPTTVTFTLLSPDGTENQYTFGIDARVTNPSVGEYSLELDPTILTVPGTYYYTVVGTGLVSASGSGDFTILGSALTPSDDVTWAVDGPCQPWCDSSDVWSACGEPVAVVGGESCPVDMTPYAQASSWTLWELSGRLHSGRCVKTVRPCSGTPCGFQILPRGFVVWPNAYDWGYGTYGWTGYNWHFDHVRDCGCIPLDRIELSGYPVREILDVKIDGVSVPAQDNWRLDKRRFLTRIANASGNAQRWPSCQRLDFDDTEPGTFSITYSYGQDPPMLGQLAAAQLACELYKSHQGQDCQLPAGTVRVTRQGVAIEKMATLGWFKQSSNRSGPQARWQTGLSLVDTFLNSSNPFGLTRRPVIMAPGQRRHRFAQSVGQ